MNRLKPAMGRAWTFIKINLATGALFPVVGLVTSYWWLALLGLMVLAAVQFRQGGRRGLVDGMKGAARTTQSSLAGPVRWYFGPDQAVDRAVSWCLYLVSGGLLVMLVWQTRDLWVEVGTITAQDAAALGEYGGVMAGLGLGYLLVAALVLAHACWQTYHAENRRINVAVDLQVARIHRLYRERKITSEHMLANCQQCGVVNLLFLGQGTDCEECERYVNRENAVPIEVEGVTSDVH